MRIKGTHITLIILEIPRVFKNSMPGNWNRDQISFYITGDGDPKCGSGWYAVHLVGHRFSVTRYKWPRLLVWSKCESHKMPVVWPFSGCCFTSGIGKWLDQCDLFSSWATSSSEATNFVVPSQSPLEQWWLVLLFVLGSRQWDKCLRAIFFSHVKWK